MRPYVMDDMLLHGQEQPAEGDLVIVEESSPVNLGLKPDPNQGISIKQENNNDDDVENAEKVIYDFRVCNNFCIIIVYVKVENCVTESRVKGRNTVLKNG